MEMEEMRIILRFWEGNRKTLGKNWEEANFKRKVISMGFKIAKT